jgi:hypothetical protein
MTASDVRDTTSTAALPRPRTAEDDRVLQEAPSEATPAAVSQAPSEPAHYPWPEPWHFSRAARPRTEFWDVTTAGWRSRGPVSGASD